MYYHLQRKRFLLSLVFERKRFMLFLRIARGSLPLRQHCKQRSGMAKLANKFVPECHEHANCARLSVAKEWTQGACEWTRRLYRKKPCQFGRGAVPPPRTAIPLLYAVNRPCLCILYCRRCLVVCMNYI